MWHFFTGVASSMWTLMSRKHSSCSAVKMYWDFHMIANIIPWNISYNWPYVLYIVFNLLNSYGISYLVAVFTLIINKRPLPHILFMITVQEDFVRLTVIPFFLLLLYFESCNFFHLLYCYYLNIIGKNLYFIKIRTKIALKASLVLTPLYEGYTGQN